MQTNENRRESLPAPWLALGAGVACAALWVLGYMGGLGVGMTASSLLILGVGILLIFVARFFIEFVKNVQVDSEIAMRQNTGLILGQWLSIPFIIWGIWLIWNANKKKPATEIKKEAFDHAKNIQTKK